MINDKIVKALETLNIPVLYIEIKNRKDKYVIFSIYNEKDSMFCNDTNLAEKYYITMNYWYNNPNDIGIYKEIKKLMKENGFIYDNGSDLKKDGEYYGKTMDFIYEELL
ncbi:MAG: hypothetical protein ACRCXT_00305 [Paraclostridium sp.]